MAEAGSGDTVRMHYNAKLSDGTVFDSSEGRDPLEFTIGENAILPDLENSVIGMAVGETATIEIAAENAYGPRREEAIQSLDRSSIPDHIDLEVGARLQASAQDGQVLTLTVVEFDDDTVTIDANHPLAGEDLTFEIQLVEIVS